MAASFQDVLLEVCVESAESARNAEANGAMRIELCSRLDLDGLSPTDEELQKCLETVSIPVNTMIRIRACDEIDSMVLLIQRWKAQHSNRLHGVVVGCLTKSDSNGGKIKIDEMALNQLVAAAQPLSVTCHRAFDLVSDQWEAIDVLKSVGIDRILTSGSPGRAEDHLEKLQRLVQHSNATSGPIVMIGGGVRHWNAMQIWQSTHANELHSSTAFSTSGKSQT
jgi:copper homeostasis protein